tara:strand:- start:123 stop:476 length:354 start_codon:yes stop_codon:yes gene_type:complete
VATSKIIYTVLYCLFTFGALFIAGNISQYIDIMSFVFVAVVAVLYTLSVKGDESYVQKFGDGAVRAGWLGSLIGIISIFGGSGFGSANMETIGPALAIASLTIFYGYFFKLGVIILD